MITVFELWCGVEQAQQAAAERAKVNRFVSAIVELPFDRVSAEAAAKIRVQLEKAGNLIGPYDLLIVGQALAGDLILVANNTREFQRVNGLRVENWW